MALTDNQQHHSNMLWLDSSYPPEKAGTPGGDRGPCPQDSGVPKEIESKIPNAYDARFPTFSNLFLQLNTCSQVIWSNIRFGPIGSTVNV